MLDSVPSSIRKSRFPHTNAAIPCRADNGLGETGGYTTQGTEQGREGTGNLTDPQALTEGDAVTKPGDKESGLSFKDLTGESCTCSMNEGCNSSERIGLLHQCRASCGTLHAVGGPKALPSMAAVRHCRTDFRGTPRSSV